MTSGSELTANTRFPTSAASPVLGSTWPAGSSRRNGRIYLTGFAASQLGDTSLALVAAIWAKELTGSTAAAALIAACIYAPTLLAPIAGAVVDRVRRRPLLLRVNGAMAVVVLLLLIVDRHSVWLLAAVMVGYGAAGAVIDPAERALFVLMIPPADRASLNGRQVAIQEGCKLVAPIAGVGLFSRYGAHPVVLLDSATFLVASWTLSLLRVDEVKPSRLPERQPWRAELMAGARCLAGLRALRRSVGVAAALMSLTGLAWACAYGLADSFGRQPTFIGWLTVALGGGSIIAGMLSGRLIGRLGELTLIRLGALACAIGFGLGCIPWLPLALTGWFVRGFGLPWVIVGLFTLAQRSVGSDTQGRLAAAINLVVFAPQPLAYLAGAGLIELIGFRVVLGAGAVVCAACLLAIAPGRRQTG